MACRLSDDEADDYENVADNRKVPALPERMKKETKTTGKKKDLQLKHMDKASYSCDKQGTPTAQWSQTVALQMLQNFNSQHARTAKPLSVSTLIMKGPRPVPSFQPPHIGLDFSSVAVNVAFRHQTDPKFNEYENERNEKKRNFWFCTCLQNMEQTSEKKCKWDWKKMVLVFCLVLMFLFWILLASIMFSYYSRISHQVTELRTNVAQIQDLSRKERETWKEELLKVNQTLVNEIVALKSDIQSIKTFLESLGLCMSCPAGWTMLDSSCFFFSTSHETWENSKKECSKMASSLLILNSQKDLDAILPFIGNKRFWIGLRKYNRDTWLWVDGTIPKFTNWFHGEPNNVAQREHCTEMISGGWNDLDCSNKIDYICKASC